ncbi:MAG: hypothetical protein JWN84_2974 [Nocardioides sp.]|nr:hypothetical protein [Nocardioides sp.]
MLNDIAWPARLLVAAFGLAAGLLLGVALADPPDGVASALLLAGLALEVAALVGLQVARVRADRAWQTELVAGTDELATGRVTPVTAVGRVVRRRSLPVLSWLPGQGATAAPSVVLVLTALGDGAPRRVAACVPPGLGLRERGQPAVLLLHPARREVAVVDDRVTPERLAAVHADPRWDAERLPTDRSVVGGLLGLLAAAVVGTAVGTGLGAAVAALAT